MVPGSRRAKGWGARDLQVLCMNPGGALPPAEGRTAPVYERNPPLRRAPRESVAKDSVAVPVSEEEDLDRRERPEEHLALVGRHLAPRRPLDDPDQPIAHVVLVGLP